MEIREPKFKAGEKVYCEESKCNAIITGISDYSFANDEYYYNLRYDDGEQLRNVLRPETIKKRYEMRDLYLLLYPLPENEEPSNQNTTVIQQQTNVVQNGDNNINLTNNGTINIKL